MAISSAIALTATTALIKRSLDDLYAAGKEAITNRIGKSRADLKEANIAKSLISITRVKTLWNVDKEVSLYDFYYPSSVQFSLTNKKINSLSDFGFKSHLVIQGTAGQGKSIFLRYLCGQELKEGANTKRIPIFVELRRVKKGCNIENLILEALEKFKLPATKDAWEFFADSGKFVLFLDAFDEIDPDYSDSAVSEIEHIIDIHGENLQVIVTSRPEGDIQRSAKFRVCKLIPLQDGDHLPFFRKICSDKNQAESMMKVIAQSKSEIRDLLTTPLMLTLLVILYKTIQTIPETLPRFYEELFDVLFYRHDHSKPGFRRKRFTKLDDSAIKKMFAAFCFIIRMQSLGVLSNAQFHSSVESASTACGLHVEPEAFKNELMKTICLLQQDGFEISFIHKSVAQYYAASFIASSNESFAEKFYKRAANGDERAWQLELKFLSEIDAYRWNKFFEIPLLDRIATTIGWDFKDSSERAKIYLRNHLSRSITLLMRENEEGTRAFGWLRPLSKDPVLKELGDVWADEINRCAGDSPEFQKILSAKYIKEEYGDTAEYTVKASDMLEDIAYHIPNLEDPVLAHLKKRRDTSLKILELENEKINLFNLLE